MSAAETMKIVQLEGQLNAKHRQVSSLINLIEQISIALDEDDVDEARRLIAEARGEE